jgi:hypothetical protein
MGTTKQNDRGEPKSRNRNNAATRASHSFHMLVNIVKVIFTHTNYIGKLTNRF